MQSDYWRNMPRVSGTGTTTFFITWCFTGMTIPCHSSCSLAHASTCIQTLEDSNSCDTTSNALADLSWSVTGVLEHGRALDMKELE